MLYIESGIGSLSRVQTFFGRGIGGRNDSHRRDGRWLRDRKLGRIGEWEGLRCVAGGRGLWSDESGVTTRLQYAVRGRRLWSDEGGVAMRSRRLGGYGPAREGLLVCGGVTGW